MRIRALRKSGETVPLAVAGLPRELERSPPRSVGLSASGTMLFGAGIGMFLAAAIGGSWLYVQSERSGQELRRFEQNAMVAEAAVTRVQRKRGDDPQTTLTYRYQADGQIHQGRVRLRKRDPLARTADIGTPMRVRYLPSDPEESWPEGYSPRTIPFWVAVAWPTGAVAGAVAILMFLRRESKLLENGRAVLARVVSVEKLRGRDQGARRLSIEWNQLSGARVRHRVDVTHSRFEAGMEIPLVYDPENPRRCAMFPMTLVKVRS